MADDGERVKEERCGLAVADWTQASDMEVDEDH